MARDALARVETQPVELAGDTSLAEAQTAISGAERVVIRFPSFKDGRGFSLAALLRRSGFEGELRAAGPLLPGSGR
jgi:phosphoadenosine phosphosulfate reductase